MITIRKPRSTAIGSPKLAATRSYGMAVSKSITLTSVGHPGLAVMGVSGHGMSGHAPISVASTSGNRSMISARSEGQIGFPGPAPRFAQRHHV